MTPVVDVPQQVVRRHLPRHLPQLIQQRQELPCRVALVLTQRIVVVSLRQHGADGRQLIGRQPHQRRAQYADERHVLPRIVHDLQQRHRHRDLHGAEKVLALPAAAGDALPRQRTGERLHPRAGRPHEDNDVLRPYRPHCALPRLHGELLIQQLPDAPRCKAGLRLSAVQRLVRCVLHTDHVQLRLPPRCWGIVRRAEVQLLLIGVVHLPHFLGHDVRKDEVSGLQHLPAGSEVAAEHHAAGLPLLGIRRVGELPVLTHKDGGVRQPEPVDALLHIAHGEQVPPCAGDSPENTVLHLVGILILVHHDLLIPLGHLPRQIRWFIVLTAQQRHGVVLLVGEIHGIAPHLLRLVALGEPLRQTQQRQHGRRCCLQILQMLPLRHEVGRGHLLLGLLVFLPHGLGRRLGLVVLTVFHRTGPLQHRLHAAHGVPALLRRLLVPAQLCRRRQKLGRVGLVYRLAVLHGGHGPFQLPRPEQGPPHCVLHHRPAVVAVCQR